MNEGISVIIPVYNAQTDLAACVASIQRQTYPHLEIILVDDGSTDTSGRLCDKIAASDSRVKVIHQANCGVSATRNKGIAAATKEYISFVDSDDYLEPDMYQRMIAISSEKQLDILACGYFITETPRETKYHAEYQEVSPRDALTECITDDTGSAFCGAVWNKLFRSSTMKQYLSFQPKYIMGEDMLVTIQCLTQACKIGVLNRPLYHYVQRTGSIVNSYRANKASSVSAHKDMISLVSKDYPDCVPLLQQRTFMQSYFLLRQALSSGGNYKDDIKILRKCLKEEYSHVAKNDILSSADRLWLLLIVRIPGGLSIVKCIYRIKGVLFL